jgi:hypothetical protein
MAAARAATATATAASATTATLPVRLADAEGIALEVGAVKGGQGSTGLVVVRHFHEAEAANLPGVAVLDNRCGGHLPVGGEGLSQIVVGDIASQIANEDIHRLLLLSASSLQPFVQRQPTGF